MDFDSFIANLQVACMDPYFSKENIAKFIANQFVGFSKTFVSNLLYASDIKDTFNKQNTADMFNMINLILLDSSRHMVHLMRFGDDYHVNMNDFSTTINSTESSEFLDKYYGSKEQAQSLNTSKFNLIKDVEGFKKKYEKNLKRVNEVLSDAQSMEKYKLYGELLTANLYKVSQGLSEITVENYYDNNSPVTIPLNTQKSPSYNTQFYFKKYAKLKTAISHSEEQKADYEANIDYLDSVLFNINESNSITELAEIRQELEKSGYINHATSKKKYKDEEKLPPYNYTFGGVTILAGRNNTQNDKLTLKDSPKNYTWLHVKDYHGSHVIVLSDSPSNELLEYAASIAVKHSEAKGSSKVSVDYTLVKNVHKPSGAKPGKVIYTDYKTIVI
jgi:predicted ribosome quality control (RQC) complex YloA/Tae2 family protein